VPALPAHTLSWREPPLSSATRLTRLATSPVALRPQVALGLPLSASERWTELDELGAIVAAVTLDGKGPLVPSDHGPFERVRRTRSSSP